MEENPQSKKRMRLSLACNECRRRKVKCDAEYPMCRNCRTRNDVCFTEDPKRLGVVVVREWVEAGPPPAPTSQQQQQQQQQQSRQHYNPPPRQQSQSLPQSQPQPRKRTHETHSPSDHQALPAQQRTGPSGQTTGQARTSPSVGGDNTNPGSRSDAFDVSPVHQPHEMSFNLDHSTDRVKMLGASSSQTLSKSLDIYFRSAHGSSVSSHFMHGMRHAEENVLSNASPVWPPLPGKDVCERYMSVFFDRIHVLYPIFDPVDMRRHALRLIEIPDLKSLTPEQIPVLASAYLIVSLGSDEDAHKPTPDGDKYLQAASSLLAHVAFMPYLAAVQCLILYTLAFRGRNKDGVGWQTIGMAIRIAHTLGLHRFSSIQPSSQHGIQIKKQQLFQARIWGICCCLEMTMQLESGRPSSIRAADKDQMMGREQKAPGRDFLQWYLGLAEIQGKISEHIYGHKPGSRSTRQLLFDTAELDAALLTWADGIPQEFRPGTDLICSSKDLHFAIHLSMQYHHAMIALHRAALIAPRIEFENEVNLHISNHASQHRLGRGEAICINSARSIARLTIELAETKNSSRILSVGAPLLCCIVLAIYLMKNANSRQQATDLETLRACAETTTQQCLDCGMNELFSRGSLAIYEQVRTHIDLSAFSSQDAHARGVARKPHQQQNGANSCKSSLPLQHHQHQQQHSHEPSTYSTTSAPAKLDIGGTTHNPSAPESSMPTFPQPFQGSYNDNNPPVPGESELLDDHSNGYHPLPELNAPFTGLNVEELWNWMLITDAGHPDDNRDWLTGTVDQGQFTQD